MVAVALASLAFLALCALVEVAAARWAVPAELSRKAAHIGGGLAAAALPVWLTFPQIAATGAVLAGAQIIARARGWWAAIHGVARPTAGAVLFPLGVAAVALLFPRPLVYVYAVLVLALADGAAALAGGRWGRRRFAVPGGEKSWAGTATFAAVALILGLVAAAVGPRGLSPVAVSAALAAAVALAATEAATGRGFDNLVVPAVAGALAVLVVA